MPTLTLPRTSHTHRCIRTTHRTYHFISITQLVPTEALTPIVWIHRSPCHSSIDSTHVKSHDSLFQVNFSTRRTFSYARIRSPSIVTLQSSPFQDDTAIFLRNARAEPHDSFPVTHHARAGKRVIPIPVTRHMSVGPAQRRSLHFLVTRCSRAGKCAAQIPVEK